MLVIEKIYSDRPDITYTIRAYLLLFEKICGVHLNEACKDETEGHSEEG